MKTMTNRERLMASLSGQPTDRVPVWLLFPYHRTGYYADVRHNPCYHSIFEASREQAIMLNRRNFNIPHFAGEIRFSENGSRLSWGGRTLVQEVCRDGDEVKLRKFLENEEDLEFFCSLPVETDEKRIAASLEALLPAYLQERAEFPEAYGSMMLDLGESIGVLYHAANLCEYPIWSLTQPEMVREFLGRLHVHFLAKYKWFLERDLADVYFMVGSELASPPMVSRDTFRSWVMPFEKQLVDLIHSYGKKVILHYHGQIKEILPDFVEIGPDGLHTIESPPVGNCTLTEAFDIVGDRITLIGNVQYDLFRSCSPEEMSAEVHSVLTETKGKRFILSPSAGPYEETISPHVVSNYHAFLDAARSFGNGTRQGV